jgi:hypothetical protein
LGAAKIDRRYVCRARSGLPQITAHESTSVMRSWDAMFRIGSRRNWMGGSVEFGTKAEEETNGDKDKHTLLFRSEDQSVHALKLGPHNGHEKQFAHTRYFPRGVVTSVPAGGVNSKVAAGMGARVWFE